MQREILIAVSLLMLPVMSLAQGNRPCAADVEKFCKGKKPGSPDAMACLKEHNDQLSEPCKARVAGRAGGREVKGRGMGPVRAMLTQCKGDLEKHCKGVQAGGGRYKACLGEHEKDLTPQCKEALGQARNAGPPKAKEGKATEEKDAKKGTDAASSSADTKAAPAVAPTTAAPAAAEKK